MGEIFLETKKITKRFGEVLAVDHVDFSVELGKIRGLIGENGSGKSTISSMICGIHAITSGEIVLQGKPYKPADPSDARAHGIGMIVQESGTVDYLSVAENIFLGEEKRFAKHGFVNKGKMEEEARRALAAVGLDIDVARPAVYYDFETRKLVEIAKALYYEPRLFIVDETTTALSQDGREKIHGIMRRLKEEGKAVLFISHDLPELMEICDDLTVLRDGELIATIEKADFDEDRIKQTMVGRRIEGNYYRADFDPSCGEEVALEAVNVSTDGLSEIELKVHKGEIVGIGGLSGSGMHELGRLFFGMERIREGEVNAYAPRPLTRKERAEKNRVQARRAWRLFTADVMKLFRKKPKSQTPEEFVRSGETAKYKICCIRDALDASIGYISKDRDKETLVMPASIRDNICLSAADMLSAYGVIPTSGEKELARVQAENLRIKCSSVNQEVRELSGGNKQKVSFAKWIGNKSKILVLDSPTRGVDVGVKTTMYQLLYDLKKQGYAIVIISEELSELIGMSDRIEIMKDGRIAKEFVRSESLRDTDIINYMI